MASDSSQQQGRGPGRRFQPGQSGNPGGRPRGVGEIRELARKYGSEAIETLVSLMRSAEKEPVRERAAEALLERGYGKPLQPLTGEDGAPLAVAFSVDLGAK